MTFWLERFNSSTHPARRPAIRRMIAVGSVLTVLVIGCRLTSDVATTNPSFSVQNNAILEVAPHGTPREQAVEALTAAGVQGAFGVAESVYYCDVWNRSDGSVWRLDVAVFFDQAGSLYKVAPSQPVGGESSASQAADVAETPKDMRRTRVSSSDANRRARVADGVRSR